jgi:hypothetical protein
MIETIYFAPNFLEDFVSTIFSMPVRGRNQDGTALQVALECSIPKIADTLAATIISHIFSSLTNLASAIKARRFHLSAASIVRNNACNLWL